MSKDRNPTVYLFVNKDNTSASLSRSHGKDASAILSHVQSCRNQKNKQLHMFRVDDGTPDSVPKRSGPPTPQSPQAHTLPSKHSSPRSSPSIRSDISSPARRRSSTLSPPSSLASASPQPQSGEKPEVDELVDYFDMLYLTSKYRGESHPHSHDLYHQIVSAEDFGGFSRQTAGGTNGYAMLACTAAKMATEMPGRRDEFEIKATKYMQPSLQNLREQLANPQARTLTDRQILQEMLLHCVTNWYLGDLTAAQTHLTAMRCLTGCLDVSRTPDRKLMDIVNRCGVSIADSQREQQRARWNSGIRTQRPSIDRTLSRSV
ncbi:hypothetical protein H2200_006654 [Cladophialophora chaetospira]|uniref:Uncharacterized protein n=1 Tax=Cladophialophora chaetospira TaxID=386627 RepID=A0AA38X8L7_9EURO|nr:hypothetical protein H2200_006654 [Cladophialophora chaetospira]